jgi:hypothetical protein
MKILGVAAAVRLVDQLEALKVELIVGGEALSHGESYYVAVAGDGDGEIVI